MEKEPEKEIMLDPRWSVLEDGLGYQVLIVGGMPGVDREGREVVHFTIKPDEIVRKRYNWRRGVEVNENGNVKFIAAKDDLIPLNMFDDANKKWLYEKTFNHQSTELSKRWDELKKRIQIFERKLWLLEADNIRLNEQLELARLSPGKWIKEGTEVYEQVSKSFADLTRKKEESSQ